MGTLETICSVVLARFPSVHAAFSHFDGDQDGRLSLNEFVALASAAHVIDEGEQRQLFQFLVGDTTTSLSFAVFSAHVSSSRPAIQSSAVHTVVPSLTFGNSDGTALPRVVGESVGLSSAATGNRSPLLRSLPPPPAPSLISRVQSLTRGTSAGAIIGGGSAIADGGCHSPATATSALLPLPLSRVAEAEKRLRRAPRSMVGRLCLASTLRADQPMHTVTIADTDDSWQVLPAADGVVAVSPCGVGLASGGHWFEVTATSWQRAAITVGWYNLPGDTMFAIEVSARGVRPVAIESGVASGTLGDPDWHALTSPPRDEPVVIGCAVVIDAHGLTGIMTVNGEALPEWRLPLPTCGVLLALWGRSLPLRAAPL